MSNDNEEMRQITTKRRSYILPISAAKTWEQRYPGSTPPDFAKNGRFWLTPDGWVFCRLDDDQPA